MPHCCFWLKGVFGVCRTTSCQFPWEQVTKKGSKSSSQPRNQYPQVHVWGRPLSRACSSTLVCSQGYIMVVFQLLYVAGNWAIMHSRWRWAIGNPSHCAVFQFTIVFHAKVLWRSCLGHGNSQWSLFSINGLQDVFLYWLSHSLPRRSVTGYCLALVCSQGVSLLALPDLALGDFSKAFWW